MTSALLVTAPHHIMEVTRRRRRRRAYTRLSRESSPRGGLRRSRPDEGAGASGRPRRGPGDRGSRRAPRVNRRRGESRDAATRRHVRTSACWRQPRIVAPQLHRCPQPLHAPRCGLYASQGAQAPGLPAGPAPRFDATSWTSSPRCSLVSDSGVRIHARNNHRRRPRPSPVERRCPAYQEGLNEVGSEALAPKWHGAAPVLVVCRGFSPWPLFRSATAHEACAGSSRHLAAAAMAASCFARLARIGRAHTHTGGGRVGGTKRPPCGSAEPRAPAPSVAVAAVAAQNSSRFPWTLTRPPSHAVVPGCRR
jgi:hypothetical protein